MALNDESRLLGLPLEIRSIIFTYTVIDRVYASIMYKEAGLDSGVHCNYALETNTAVLLICRQLHRELKAIMPQVVSRVIIAESDATAVSLYLLEPKNTAPKLSHVVEITIESDPEMTSLRDFRSNPQVGVRPLLMENRALAMLVMKSGAEDVVRKYTFESTDQV